MAWYKTGTVSVSTGATSITGVGTKFASNARVGDGFRGPDGEWYEVVNIASETTLGIFPAYVGATVAGSVNWMIAPLQGYNKDSADKLRAITDNMVDTIESIKTKQDKSPKLTSLAGIQGVANRLTVPTLNSNGDNFTVLQISNNASDTGDTKIPLSGHAGWGTTTAIQITAAQVDTILQCGIYAAASYTPGGPSTGGDYYITNKNNGSGWCTQYAEGIAFPRAFSRWRHGGTGVWSAWIEIFQTSPSIEAYSAQKLNLRNVLGIGTPHTYCTNIDALTHETGLVLGYSYVNGTTAGTIPTGYSFGVVNTVINAGDHCQQEFVGLTGTQGVTQNSYRRSGYGGSGAASWGPWRLVIDSASGILDPASGGICSSTVIGGLVVSKYANGDMHVRGPGNNTATLPANQATAVNVALPVTAVNGALGFGFSGASKVQPQISYDHYGIVSEFMQEPSVVGMIIRNGASAQIFQPYINVWMRWK